MLLAYFWKRSFTFQMKILEQNRIALPNEKWHLLSGDGIGWDLHQHPNNKNWEIVIIGCHDKLFLTVTTVQVPEKKRNL